MVGECYATMVFGEEFEGLDREANPRPAHVLGCRMVPFKLPSNLMNQETTRGANLRNLAPRIVITSMDQPSRGYDSA